MSTALPLKLGSTWLFRLNFSVLIESGRALKALVGADDIPGDLAKRYEYVIAAALFKEEMPPARFYERHHISALTNYDYVIKIAFL
jgi:hypothetical protein